MPELTAARPPAKTELKARYRLALGEYVTALAVSADGRLAVVGLGDGRVIGFDPGSGSEQFTLEAHPGGVLGLGMSPDGAVLATCGPEPVAKLWTRAGAPLCELPSEGPAWVEQLAWAPSGGRLATAAGKKVRVWTAAGEPVVESEPLASTVSALAWRADAAALAASCYGGVHIMPLSDAAPIRHLAWKGSLITMAWSPDGRVIACGSQDSSVHFWRLPGGKNSQMSGYSFKPKALAWDRDASLLATSGDATVTAWDFRGKGPEGTRPLQLRAHLGLCTELAFSPRKCVLASGSQDTSVLLWEPRRGEKPVRFGFLKDVVTRLAWHPHHHTLLAADASGTLCGWEVP